MKLLFCNLCFSIIGVLLSVLIRSLLDCILSSHYALLFRDIHVLQWKLYLSCIHYQVILYTRFILIKSLCLYIDSWCSLHSLLGAVYTVSAMFLQALGLHYLSSSYVRFTLVRFTLVRFTLVRFTLSISSYVRFTFISYLGSYHSVFNWEIASLTKIYETILEETLIRIETWNALTQLEFYVIFG